MSTPEQPLTRKQLRELQRTGSVPVQDGTQEEAHAEREEPASPPVAPLAKAAEPASVEPAPISDSSVDLEATPLTRRQARQQEKIRTASVPVIVGEHSLQTSPDEEVDAAGEDEESSAPVVADESASVETASGADDERPREDIVEELVIVADENHAGDVGAGSVTAPRPATVDGAEEGSDEGNLEEAVVLPEDTGIEAQAGPSREEETPSAPAVDAAPTAATDEDDAEVNPAFGAQLLDDSAISAASAPLPPSFDELIARNASATTAFTTPSALILSQTPAAPSLSGPITATGEVIITGSYQLPAGLGSAGHDPRTTDGKDVDSVLIDGELPASSSPTPIAASAAISTIRGSDEIIRPPAPEKGNKWIFALAITAGVLAAAVVGLVIVAVLNGAFA